NPGGLFDRIIGREDLKDILPQTDVLIMSLPGTTDTKGILGKEELSLLPDGAVIINVGRGTSIDQSALEKELLSGRLSAGLDVFEKEPIPAESPLWSCRSLIITPHVAGNMRLPYTTDRIIQMFLEDLDRYCAGKPLLHLADVRNGY
ncbi:MAG: NAD(P)-dependent oxidoreductase, partial [bacterium]